MNVQVKSEGVPFPAVSVAGEVDVYTAPQLREKILEIEAAHRTFILNLQEVSYMDSTGLGVLIGSLKRTKEKGGSLYLVFTNPMIKKIFDITGLSQVFDIFSSEPDLLKSLETGKSS